MTMAIKINEMYDVVLVSNNNERVIRTSVEDVYSKLLDKDSTTVHAIIKQVNMSLGHDILNEFAFNQYKLRAMNTETHVSESINAQTDAKKAFYDAKMRELQKGYMKLLANN